MGFTGREYDAETGLYHFRARVYDPDVGRFVQSDPIRFAAGDLNPYAYSWNDPENWSDPCGLAVTMDWTIRLAETVRLASGAVTGIAGDNQNSDREEPPKRAADATCSAVDLPNAWESRDRKGKCAIL